MSTNGDATMQNVEDIRGATNSNTRFLDAVFGHTDTEGHIAYTSFAISPQLADGEWKARLAPLGKCPKPLETHNNYFITAMVGEARTLAEFKRLAVLVLDDLKGAATPLAPSYRLETSAGNFQYGYIIVNSPESRDVAYVGRAIQALIAANLMADQSGNNAVRYVRMLGSNTKKDNIDADGKPFACVLRELEPTRRYTIAQVLAAYGVTVGAAAPAGKLNGAKPGPDLQSQIRTLVSAGPGMHDAQVSVGMKFITHGLDSTFAKQLLGALTCYDGTERTEGRLADVDRCIDSAVDKINAEIVAREVEPLDTGDPSIQTVTPVVVASVLRVTPMTLATLKAVPPEPEIVVEDLLLMDACGFVAPGGMGKTTLAIFEAIHIILGRPLWRRRVIKPGRVVLATAEDSKLIVETRVVHICNELALSDAELQIVAEGLYIEDLSMSGARLVGTNPITHAIQATKLVDDIIERYRDLNVSLVHLDPASLLGPGEQSGNDGMSELMRAARRIAADLGAACQIVHHVAQVVARNGIQDQYAGRGGTFADNSRGQRQLVRIKERGYEFDGRRYRMPDEITDDQLARGRVLAILVHKLSYVELDPTPIFILRSGFSFRQFEAAASTAAKVELTMDESLQVIAGFLQRELQNNTKHSPSSLELKAKEYGLSQPKARALIKIALERDVFVYVKNPQKGGAQQYLTVAEEADDDLQQPA
jgi:regulatory protein RepA